MFRQPGQCSIKPPKIEDEHEHENGDLVPVPLKRSQRRFIRWRLHFEELRSVPGSVPKSLIFRQPRQRSIKAPKIEDEHEHEHENGDLVPVPLNGLGSVPKTKPIPPTRPRVPLDWGLSEKDRPLYTRRARRRPRGRFHGPSSLPWCVFL
jgi:hypothetical protein